MIQLFRSLLILHKYTNVTIEPFLLILELTVPPAHLSSLPTGTIDDYFFLIRASRWLLWIHGQARRCFDPRSHTFRIIGGHKIRNGVLRMLLIIALACWCAAQRSIRGPIPP